MQTLLLPAAVNIAMAGFLEWCTMCVFLIYIQTIQTFSRKTKMYLARKPFNLFRKKRVACTHEGRKSGLLEFDRWLLGKEKMQKGVCVYIRLQSATTLLGGENSKVFTGVVAVARSLAHNKCCAPNHYYPLESYFSALLFSWSVVTQPLAALSIFVVMAQACGRSNLYIYFCRVSRTATLH